MRGHTRVQSGASREVHYPGNVRAWRIAHSKLTSQGQISVPASIRRKLGVGPGSILEWDEEGDNIVIRRSGRFSSEDIRLALFSKKARKTTHGRADERGDPATGT